MTIRMRQKYHLEAPAGLLNDPNGLSWFCGKYYVFFQWNRQKKDHSYKEWGLFTSDDLIRWKFEGSAIVPGQEYDRNGVYSGSGCVMDGELCLFYTGNRKEEGQRISSQCLAVTRDGRNYKKKGVVLSTPEEYTGHFRDPKVFRQNGSGYFMVIGGQRKNGKGAVALCRSSDGRKWDYQGVLAVSDQYEMIECPDLFKLGGQWVLLYNPQKRNTAEDKPEFGFSAYKLEEFDENTGTFLDNSLDTGAEEMDKGFDFYAPQTLEAPDGRRILFAWMSGMDETQEAIFGKDEPNIHCLTVPRELFLSDGRLCQRPIRELYHMLGQELDPEQETEGIRIIPGQRAFFLKLHPGGPDGECQIIFHQGESKIEYSPEERSLTFSRKSWINDAYDIRSIQMGVLEEIEIWSDYSSLEIFVNGGKTVFSARTFPEKNKAEVFIKGNVKVRDVQAHKIIKRGGKSNE